MREDAARGSSLLMRRMLVPPPGKIHAHLAGPSVSLTPAPLEKENKKPLLNGAKLDTVRRMGKRNGSPKHWPYLALIGVARLACLLPVRWWLGLGRGIGHIGYRVAERRRRIAETNIRLCFPDLDENERADLVQRTFLSVGMLAMEMAYCWSRPIEILARRAEIHGLEALREAQADGRGVLLIGGHYLTLDLGAALLSTRVDLDAVYRLNKNPAIERLMLQGRKRFCGRIIERNDIRRAIRSLRDRRLLWYAPDQDYGIRHSVFAPFFGQTAATIATSRLVRLTGARPILFSHFRDPEKGTWSLYLQRIENYPTGDHEADATRLNQLIEGEIRKHPDQYLWLHRRFKTRPEGVPSPYA